MNSAVRVSVLLCVACMVGCATKVTTRVLRPAQINAQLYGGTMTVGQFTADRYDWYGVAEGIKQTIREAIVGCPGGVVRYVEHGAGLTIFGRVSDYSYHEEMSRVPQVCTRFEGTGAHRREVRYPCVRHIRTGRANVKLVFNVMDSAGQTIVASTFSDSDSATTDAVDATPPPIDGNAMLHRLAHNLTTRFTRVVIPWWDTVDLPFWDCGDAPECKRGIDFVRAGQWEQAIASFDAAIARIQGTPGHDPEDLAEAYWNKGICQQYTNDFAGAVASLSMAVQLDPDESDYVAQLEEVRRSQAEAEQLRQQGIGGGTADDVAAGGTP